MARPVGLLYPDPILRQRDKPTGLMNVQAMRAADNREVLRGLLGPAYQQIEPFINAGATIGDAFTEAPSEFASFGGVMPAWRQAGEHWQAGKYPEAVAYGTQSIAEGLLDAITAGQGTAVKTAVAKGLPALLQPSAATAGKAIIGTAAAAPYAQPAARQIKGLIGGTEELRPVTGPKGLLQDLAGMVKSWHGSRHARAPEEWAPGRAFKAEKILSGEGGNAYGWGHYLAQAKDTGKTYMKAGLDAKDLPGFEASNKRLSALRKTMNKYSSDAGLPWTPGHRFSDLRGEKAASEYNALLKERQAIIDKSGNLYRVEMDVDEVDLLDWDKMLDEQPPEVMERLRKTDWYNFAEDQLGNNIERNPTGEDLYRWLLQDYDKKEASLLLNEAGIPGIRYDDAMSRGEKAGTTSNYVIFDDKLLKIVGEGDDAAFKGGQVDKGLLGGAPDTGLLGGHRGLLAAGGKRGANPRKFVNKQIREGNIPETARDEAIVELIRIKGVQDARAANRPGFDGLLNATWKRQRQVQDIKADRHADKLLAQDTAGMWNKASRDEIARAAKSQGIFNVNDALSRATLEAVPRALKKQGWKLRHSSGKWRKDSRYVVSPDGKYEVRLSNHYLPDTPQREYSRTQSSPRWDDEYVISGNEDPAAVVDEILGWYAEAMQ